MILGKFAAQRSPQSPGNRIFTNAVVVAVFLTLAKLAGAGKIILMANRFGANDQVDAFLVAFAIPAFFSEVLAGSLPPALVPALIGVREAEGRAAMYRLHGSVTLLVLGLLTAGCAVLLAGAPLLLQVLAAGFSEDKRAFAQSLFYWLALFVPCGGLSVMWRAALIAEEHFAASSAAMGMTPVVAALALWFARPGASVWLLVSATLAGIALELAVLGAAMWRARMPLFPRWGGWDETMRRVLVQYLPLIAAAAIGGGSLLVDQAMAATLAPGSVSALNYGTKLATVLAAIGGGAIGTAVLPPFSRMVNARSWDSLWALFKTNAGMILLVAVPVSAVMAGLSERLVPWIFAKHLFGPGAAALIASVQRFSLPQIPLALLLAMALRLVSAMHLNRILVRVAAVSAVAGVAGNLTLMRVFGVSGIALTNTLVMLLSFILVISAVRGRIAENRVLDFKSSHRGNEV